MDVFYLLIYPLAVAIGLSIILLVMSGTIMYLGFKSFKKFGIKPLLVLGIVALSAIMLSFLLKSGYWL